jgi:hypothetical protein
MAEEAAAVATARSASWPSRFHLLAGLDGGDDGIQAVTIQLGGEGVGLVTVG